jgi:hypothetical protein
MGEIMQFVWWTENVNQRVAVVSCLKHVSETMETCYGPVFRSRFARGTSRIKLKLCRTLPLVVLFAALPRRWIFGTFSRIMDVHQYVAELKDWFVCKRKKLVTKILGSWFRASYYNMYECPT